ESIVEKQMSRTATTAQRMNAPMFFHCDDVPRQTVSSGMSFFLSVAWRRTSATALFGEHARPGRWFRRLAETIFKVRKSETLLPTPGTGVLPGFSCDLHE